MYYGIVAFPQKHVQDKVNALRKRYDPHYSLIPPHITLKEKFELSDDKLEKAVQDLERIAKEVKAFQIKFHKISLSLKENLLRSDDLYLHDICHL